MAKPGDPVPEAEGWKNVASYVRRGWLCLEGMEPVKRNLTMREVNIAMDGQLPAPPAKPAVAAAAPEPEVTPEPEPEASVEESEGISKKTLKSMDVSQLQELADTMGVNPDQTKGNLVKAILAAQ